MNDSSWDRITDAIEANFGLVDHGHLTRPIEDAPELTEKVAFVVFDRSGERFKLERVTGPAIIDRKTMGAKRVGATVHFENVYDPDELAHKTNMLKLDGDEWVTVDPSSLGI